MQQKHIHVFIKSLHNGQQTLHSFQYKPEKEAWFVFPLFLQGDFTKDNSAPAMVWVKTAFVMIVKF